MKQENTPPANTRWIMRVNIRCDMYRNDPETGRERYGVYVLESEVVHIADERVAA